MMPFVDETQVARCAIDQAFAAGLDLRDEVGFPDEGSSQADEVGVK
jgi:hypothetical protein